MGYTSWEPAAWTSYAAATSVKSTEEIFKSRSIKKDLDPFGVVVRESRDSAANPESTAIIVACDVTGSMGVIADYLVRTGIGIFFEEVLNRKPVTDPHLMIMGIGDAKYDTAPLQVSQFEADLKIAEWLEQIYIEHGGGGNRYESYDLAYYFAYNHTSIDCFEKRNKKGYLFTIGDEQAPPKTFRDQVQKFVGDEIQDIPFNEIIDQASKMYHCFHIMIAEGNHARHYPDDVKNSWREVMGQRAIWLEDHKKLSETIVSAIQLTEGESIDKVLKSWSGDTTIAVRSALGAYSGTGVIPTPSVGGRGVARL